MAGINRATVSGNLVRDPDLKSTKSGTQVINFCVAVNDRSKNPSTGEWEDYANFIDCVMFGSRAEWLSRNLRKGTHVTIDGKLRYTSWEKDGSKRSKIELAVDDIDFQLPPRDGQQQGYQQQQQPYQQPQQSYHPQQNYQPQPQPADDIPF